MRDVLTLCENCDKEPSISTPDDLTDLCARCELELIEEMAAHEDDCACVKAEEVMPLGITCDLHCVECTCGIGLRVARRKVWLRTEIGKAAG